MTGEAREYMEDVTHIAWERGYGFKYTGPTVTFRAVNTFSLSATLPHPRLWLSSAWPT